LVELLTEVGPDANEENWQIAAHTIPLRNDKRFLFVHATRKGF
jgi:hypothetical protein